MDTNNNADKDLLFQQYKLCYEMKERFIDRNFMTNKFYVCLVIAIMLIMFFTGDVSFKYNISATLIMAILGMGITFSWWSNLDTYNSMIKIKLNMMEKFEEQMPIQAHLTEFKDFIQSNKKKRTIIFSDMQKGLAILMFLVFCCLFLIEMVFPVTTIFAIPI